MDIPIKIKFAQFSCETLSTYNITTQLLKFPSGLKEQLRMLLIKTYGIGATYISKFRDSITHWKASYFLLLDLETSYPDTTALVWNLHSATSALEPSQGMAKFWLGTSETFQNILRDNKALKWKYLPDYGTFLFSQTWQSQLDL